MRKVRLYRSAINEEHALAPGGFWTPLRAYARWVHPDYPIFTAALRIEPKKLNEFTTGWRLGEVRDAGHRVVSMPSATYRGSLEYVVYDPRVLSDVRVVARSRRVA